MRSIPLVRARDMMGCRTVVVRMGIITGVRVTPVLQEAQMITQAWDQTHSVNKRSDRNCGFMVDTEGEYYIPTFRSQLVGFAFWFSFSFSPFVASLLNYPMIPLLSSFIAFFRLVMRIHAV